jgi:hypothetical protein
MMAYHNQNYWVFGLFPSSGIVGNRKHNISETVSVSILRCGGGKVLTKLGPLRQWTIVIAISCLRDTT